MSKYIVENSKYSGVDNDYQIVEREVEADSVKVQDRALIFFTEKKITRVFADGTWDDCRKIS